MEVTLKLVGILMGVLCRTTVPYLRKLRDGKVDKFETKYLLSALAAFILGAIITLLIFPEFNLAPAGVGVEASIRLFCAAFAFGFGFNAIMAEGAKWTETVKR